jgi:outer membrane protein assembly factor BamB
VGDGEFYATAAVAFGRVYVGATDGRMYSLSAQDGRLAWAHQTGGYVYSSPAVTRVAGRGPTVFFGSYDGVFYALDARTGEPPLDPPLRRADLRGPDRHRRRRLLREPRPVADLRARHGTGREMVRFKLGGYDPVISDGRHLFVTGRRSLTAYLPRNR